MRIAGTALLAALLVACGGEGKGPPTAQEIERLSTPKNMVVPTPPLVLPLTPAALASAGMTQPSCAFTRDGALLLAAAGNGALANVGGADRRLAAAAPVGPTGGFFEDAQVSASVGRGDAGSRLVVTDRGADRQEEFQGEWTCRTPA